MKILEDFCNYFVKFIKTSTPKNVFINIHYLIKATNKFLLILFFISIFWTETLSQSCPDGYHELGPCVGFECPRLIIDYKCINGLCCGKGSRPFQSSSSNLLSNVIGAILGTSGGGRTLARRLYSRRDCSDRAVNCIIYRRFCNFGIFLQCMAHNCASTCSLCGLRRSSDESKTLSKNVDLVTELLKLVNKQIRKKSESNSGQSVTDPNASDTSDISDDLLNG